jgi:hypothetical protein
MTRKVVAYDCIFILLVASICHFLFSRYGFNPTDEGFVLSATNRVMHGLVSHVDFSSVRPLGYAYLHIPELLISKDYFFLVSRFVFWLEHTAIAFFWIRFIEKYIAEFGYEIEETIFGSSMLRSRLSRYMLVLVTLIFNVHYFPCSVLHTIDGLLFCVIGLNLVISHKNYSFLGFFFLGFAALCKQNYIVVLPAVIWLFNKKQFVLNFIAGILPVAVYAAFISYYGGWNDLTTQLRGHSELLQVGVEKYVLNVAFWLGAVIAFIYKRSKLPAGLYVFAILLVLSGLLVTNHYHGSISFMIVGILIVEYYYAKVFFRKIIAICILLAWCVSISVGYNTPALFAGGCFAVLILLHYEQLQLKHNINYFTVVFLFAEFYFMRTNNIYRDLPSTLLTYNLDGIVEGASGIYTNKNTYSVLLELDSLKKQFRGLVPIPDFTACNILHSHQSKIATEWPNKTEIPNTAILVKVVKDLKRDSTTVFAIPKYETASLAYGFTELKGKGMNYPIVQYVKRRYSKFGETSYFELFR